MNSQTIINLPDLIRNARSPYTGCIGSWIDDTNFDALNRHLANLGIDAEDAESLDEMLALVPEGGELAAVKDMYDDPNAKIIKLVK